MINYHYSKRASLYQYSKFGRLFNHIEIVTRIWGIFTAIVLLGIGVDIHVHLHTHGLLLMVFSAVTAFLEIIWLVDLFLTLCDNNLENGIYWEMILQINTWKKSSIYLCGSIILFIYPHHARLLSIGGITLLLLATLHGVLTFKDRYQIKANPLLDPTNNYDASVNNEGFDDITKIFSGPSISADNLSTLGQDEILEL